ncbi:hypothetical protein SSTU70S_05716 [Stutzerimonas stutzeri]
MESPLQKISDNIKERAIGLILSFLKDESQPSQPASSPSGGSSGVVGKSSVPASPFQAGAAQSGAVDRYFAIKAMSGTGGVDADKALLDAVDVESLVSWLNDRVTVQGIGLTTAKCYRRWLASYFESQDHEAAALLRCWIPPGSMEEALIEDEVDARQIAEPLLTVESVPTNTRHVSFMDGAALRELLEQLLSLDDQGNQRYVAGPAAALMFTVSMMTGLRPMEWPSARYRETFFDPETALTLGPVLEIHTCKQSNRREDNPLRTKRYLLLDEWPEDQQVRLKALLSEIASVDDFSGYYNRVRMTLNRAWRRVAKNRGIVDVGLRVSERTSLTAAAGGDDETVSAQTVSLYTSRHIFAEETRRSLRYTRFELAAMLGHSLLTNQVYYGPRTQHENREFEFALPRPWPGDAEDIKQWDRQVNPLRYKFMQGDLFAGETATAIADEGAGWREDRDGASSFFMR